MQSINFPTSEQGYKVYKDIIVAKEGILYYPGKGYGYKSWNDLKRFIGRKVPITLEHPRRNINPNTDGEKIVGVAEVKKCSVGKNILCADLYVREDIKKTRGVSVGYEGTIINYRDNIRGYDFIQNLRDINHIALTESPRDFNTLLDSSQSSEGVLISDSLIMEESKMVENQNDEKLLAAKIEKKYEEEKKTLIAQLDSLKGEVEKYKEFIKAKKIEEMKGIMDSLKGYGFEDKDFEGATEDFLKGAKWACDKLSATGKGRIMVVGDSRKKNISDSEEEELSILNLKYKDGNFVL